MKTRQYFQTRIRLLGIASVLLGAATLISVGLIAIKYENLVERIRDRGLSELQRYQDVERQVANVHMHVIELITDRSSAIDEQRLYAESKKVADTLDQLIGKLSARDISPNNSGMRLDQEFRDSITRYRSDVLLTLEMMTVNPRLAERYLLRSAVTLSQLNIAVATNFDARRTSIQEDMSATKDETAREVVLLIIFILLTLGAVLVTIFRLMRRLSDNLRKVENSLRTLNSTSREEVVSIEEVDGEFKVIAESLSHFRAVQVERDFTRSQMLAIFDSILEAVVVIDDRGGIIQTNPMVTKLFGYTQEELVGKNVRILTPPEVETNHDHYLKRYQEKGNSGAIVGKSRTTDGRHRDGHLFPVQLAVSEILVGNIRYFVGVIADITERVANERVLKEARDEALSASRIKAEFLANMSHEIRTPMNGILGMAQLLADDGIVDEDRRRCARILLNSSETLITLLNDILDLSKVEAGKLTFNPQPTSPATVAEQAAALFVETLKAKGVQLDVFSTELAHNKFMLDPTRVRQMLSNLIGNAVKFTEAGQIRIEASVSDEGNGGGRVLTFRVTDSGPGIAPEDLPKLFGKYLQLDNSTTRHHGGTGLGLSLVREFAQAMDGKVGAESTLGKGSTFWFSLPALPPPDAASPQDAAEASSSKGLSASRESPVPFRKGALIAEDLPANQVVLRLMLKRLGVESMSVNNGREAVEAVMRDGPFDFIFMDMRMPDMGGEEATRLIRQWESSNALTRCPIIAVTANAYEADRTLCEAAGMDYFLAKPVKISELREIVERCLNQRRSVQVYGKE